jgi:pimeloyl-ACP methyl ester carboxylesterase
MSTVISPRSAASGLTFARVALASGVRIHYAAQGSSYGVPTVFLHGYTDSWFSFSRVLPLLPRDRFWAIAPDQRGHGDSDRPPRGYSIDDFATDLVALLDALGIGRANLVGHSLSSVIARRVAARYPERVDRLVLVGAVATPVRPVVNELRDAIQDLVDPVPEDFIRDFQASTIQVPVPERFFNGVVAASKKLPARVWRSILDGLLVADDSQSLARISAPTLLIWGEQDAYFLRREQQFLVQAIPDARLTVYEDTGHSPHWERPEQFARDVQAFLS